MMPPKSRHPVVGNPLQLGNLIGNIYIYISIWVCLKMVSTPKKPMKSRHPVVGNVYMYGLW